MSSISAASLAAWILAASALAAPGDDGPPTAGTGGLFEEMPVVEAASLHSQTLQEAPANVTLVSEEDIRKYGYRTLGEALSGARGFYMTSDRAYQYVGLRGFLLPGDYNTRFLVMIDGHAMTEVVFNSNGFFGQDFGLDMDLVKRIEIIRGPASALYGSNGIFCTVNIVTKAPVERPTGTASVEIDSFGERKAQASSSIDFGRGANLLVSFSAFNNAGQTLYYPEYDSPETANGWARGVDGERGYHAFANFVWGDWSLLANFGDREKVVPVMPWFPTSFADRGNKIEDARGFIEARYSRELSAASRLHVRAYYDRYVSNERYDTAIEGGIQDERDFAQADWAGAAIDFRRQWPRFGATTVGAEGTADLRNLQRADIVSPEPLNIFNSPKSDLRGGLFAQHELDLSKRWKADIGARYDVSRLFNGFVSPRAALLFQQSPATVYKLLWGRAFRNPSVFEAFYDDGGLSQLGNPSLRPERASTWETSWERRVAQRITLVATAYRYDLHGLIQAIPVDDEGIVYQYRNVSESRAYGMEFEIGGHLRGGAEGVFSFAEQRTRDLGLDQPLPNSPAQVAKARVSAPLWKRRIHISVAGQYLGGRITLAGNRLAGVPLAEFTVSTSGLTSAFDLQFGVRNLLDRRYDDPAGGAMTIDQIRADGRSAYLRVIWRTRG